MSRDWTLYLDDMLACCRKVVEFTAGMDMDSFLTDSVRYDAVLRNLEILGEAAKKIPDEIRLLNPQIEWRKIMGLRDVLAHFYFGIEDETLWDVIRNKIPPLITSLEQMR